MKEKSDYVRDWLLKAASDMKIAMREMGQEDAASDAVCFHFQRAVEKTLKAGLIWNEAEFRPTHNIEVLLAQCETIDQSFEQLCEAETLTPYAVEIRYADDIYFPSREEMKEAAEIAARTRSFVLDKLHSAGLLQE